MSDNGYSSFGEMTSSGDTFIGSFVKADPLTNQSVIKTSSSI
jgi:hypothetical protein